MNSDHNIDLPDSADFSYIQDIAGGQNDAFWNLLRIIGKNLREYPPQLVEAHQKGELEEVKTLAHKYKSCTAYLNFPQLDQNLDGIEVGIANGLRQEEVEPLIEKVKVLSDFMENEVSKALGQQ